MRNLVSDVTVKNVFSDILVDLKDTKDKGIVFVRDWVDDLSMSYSTIYYKSLHALACLQAKGVKPGMQAIFQVNSEEDFVVMCWACILGGIVGVPLNVTTNYEKKNQLLRIWSILDNPFLLTNKANADKLSDFFSQNAEQAVYEELKDKTVLYDEFDNTSDAEPAIYESDPENMILLLFSSGSTGDPKAIIITHKTLMINIRTVSEFWNLNENNGCILSWMPLTHVMGLFLQHFLAVLNKTNQVIIPPALFVAEPMLWLKKVDEYRATMLLTPNFGMRYVVENMDTSLEETLDLSSVKMICNCAEPISISVCNQFLDTLEKCNLDRNTIIPMFGMTEASMSITAGGIGEAVKSVYVDRRNIAIGNHIIEINPMDDNAFPFVMLGKPIPCCNVRVCDENSNPLEEDWIGYVQIKGDSITNGYYNNEKATSQSKTKDGWLITGDVGFLHDGELVITGRVKDIIFVNGQNFYPHDIERVAESAEGLKGRKVVVTTVKTQEDQSEGVGIFVQFEDDARDFIEIIRSVKETVNEKMGLEVYDVVPISIIPKTGSGKIRRYQLGEQYNEGKFAAVLHKISATLLQDVMKQEKKRVRISNETEELLLDILQQELNTETIDVDTSFFQFGINSLTMMKISARLKSEFRVNVDIGTLFECKNISTLAKIIEQKEVIFEENIYPFVGADVKRMHDKFPLTEIQASYLLGREEGYELGNISTHVYIELKTQLDIPRINRGLKKLINKHAMMRAIFIENQQRILKKVPEYIIECEELHGLTKSEIDERLLSERNRMSHHVFKPEKWPLFEFKAIKCDDVSHYLLIGLDMLIIDASGIDSLATELMEFYKDEEREVEQIDFSFRDYVLAYKEFKNSAVYENDKRYWLKKLNDFPAAPNLPTKVDVSKIETPVFKRVQKLIDLERWEKLKNEAMLHQVTPSSLLCTIYLEVLAFWSNQPKLAINLTIVNRYPFHPEVDKLLGDFTSVIPVDADFSQNELFWNKVKIVQNMIMAGLEHRHYDGVEFIRELASANNYVNKAVIPVVFTSLLANEVWGKWNKIGELNYIITQTSQVYLDYQASEMDGQLLINWDYISDLLDDKMVQDMFDQYIDRLTRISDSSIELDNVMISHHDLMKIQQYNDTNEEIKSALLHQLFEEQVERNADQLAIINGDHRMIYRELNEKANQVARKLIELGVQDNELIGVSAARCIESIANIMGILKAGGAYVPIDPQYPQERIKYILDHSQCKMMLEPDFYTTHQLDAYASDNLQRDVSVDQTAYVIYTSGSTGKPKGVVITHRAVANTILDINRKFNVNEKDRILGISSMCFDLSVYDIFGALTAGATLIQIPDQRDVIDIYETIEKYEVTIWNSVPAIMDMILHNMQGRSTYEEVEHAGQEIEEASQVVVRREKYYWSPAVSWDEEFYLDGYVYVDSEMLTLFPHFYFFMQKGCHMEEIYTEFPNMPKNKLKSFVQELLEQRVLVSTILNPHEVFRSQEKLFDNPYNEDILYNPQSYGKFKKKQLTRKFQGATGEKVPLAQPYPFPSYLQERKSHRKFNENEKIPLVYISQLLSVFRQRELDHHIQYYYPSAGGLYPIDIFLYVKEDRIEQLRKGIYYYNPIDNSLSLVNGDCVITEDAHFYTNKSIFNSSATSIYMIYNAEATMPKYGGSGYLYACIDTGIMISTMVHVAEMLNIGTCSIGEMEFETIKDQFKLNHKQVLIHTVELGFKEDIDIKKTGFHVNLIDKEAIETISVTDAKQTIKTQMQARLNKVGRAEIMNERTNNSVLRLVLLSGDWIPLSLPQKIKNYFVNADVISLGGATEASIWSIYYPVGEVTSIWKSVPYGKPLANQKFYVLNYQGNLCPIGVSGELYIGGVGLAKEYANDPDKTNQSFIEHPVFGKLYKTGDHGRMLEKGVIEFLGRKDQQVKIRGHRIELGEIENCLIAHPEIQNVTVVDYTEKNGKKYLCAYIVSEKNIEPKELREHVIRELPEYMLPAFFVQIKNIPLTVNGKVDRKSLPKPNVSNPAHKEQLKPSNELEQVIWSIWKKIIKKDEISINDNFFDIGGDSMLLAHVHSELEKLYPKMLRVTDLFTSTSISRLAESLANKIKMTKKRLDIQAVKLPLEYFSGHGNVAEYTVFMYTMDVKSTNQLKNLAVMQSISMEELLTSFYMYILNQVSGENRIGIHTMIDRRNTLYSIEVDFGNFTQFDQLFEEVKGRASSDPFMIQDIALMDKQRVDLSIVPAIMRKNLCPANMNLTEFYDFLLVLEQSNHELHLVCEYNGSKLKADKARSLFNDYVKLIKAYLKRV